MAAALLILLSALLLAPLVSSAQEAQWELVASSQLAPQGGNYYDVYRLFDGEMGTAWVEGVGGSGVGEYFTLTLKSISNPSVGGIYLTGFNLNNGYCKDRDTWLKNGRIKKLKIYLNGKTIYNGDLEDTMREQSIVLGGHYIGIDDTIMIEISDVFPGTEYEDTAISELIPVYTLAR